MIRVSMNFNEKDFEKLNKLGIECLILCGSQAQKVVKNKSDYDFLVLGPKNQKTYDILYDMLSEKINKLTDIDIVFESAAPMEFKQHAAKYGIVLYEKRSSVFADFKQKVMIEYSDFAPYRAIFSNATLARIQP